VDSSLGEHLPGLDLLWLFLSKCKWVRIGDGRDANNSEVLNSPQICRKVFRNGSGAFAACEHRAVFIDAEKWASLGERAFQKFMKHHSVPRHSTIAVRVQFADLVRLFAEHEKGDN
jgi:hypothetical protein